MKQGYFVAVVAVRKGSQRIPNKNIKPFGDSNLLEMKLNILKEVPDIDEIIVNSDFGRYKLSSNNAKILDNINEEDQLRADMYSFLANLLRAEPDEKLVKQLTFLESDNSPIGKSIKTLSLFIKLSELFLISFCKTLKFL